MRRLRRLLELPREQRSLLVRAYFRVAAAVVLVRVLPFRAWSRLLRDRDPEVRCNFLPPAREVARAVRIAAGHVRGANCLPVALALHQMLRVRGHRSSVRIGVSKRGEGLLAHAWVVSGGQVLIGGDFDVHYTPLAELRTAASS